MNQIKTHDIIIIGGGAAGLRAAIAAAEKNPQISIAIISKVYPVRSHSVCAEGGIAAALSPDDSEQSHFNDTVYGSDFLADQDAVEYFVKEAKNEILRLENWGCPWNREQNGDISVRAFGGMSKKRTIYAADKTGFFLLNNLFERSLRYQNITRYDEWFVTDLITENNQVQGLIALGLKTGKLETFQATSIIIATGGAGKIYKNTTNSSINTGDGIALAYRAGATLKDMEMVQFHPTTLNTNNILITEAARGEGGYLINKHGHRFLKDYIPNKMELGPRDIITRAITSEIQKGNAFTNDYGPYIGLDLRHIPKKQIEEKLPMINETVQKYLNLDLTKDIIPIIPAQHYFMGGISTDLTTKTTIKNLYAAGETACISMHGANRMGSNSLAECLVFGEKAGLEAAISIVNGHTKHPTTINNTHLINRQKQIQELLSNKGNTSVQKCIQKLQEIVENSCGIIREKETLRDGLKALQELKAQTPSIAIREKSLVFNTELISYFEYTFMLDIAETVIKSALQRQESRGSHYRLDYPSRNDKDFLHHIIIKKGTDQPLLEKQEVKITKYLPIERTY